MSSTKSTTQSVENSIIGSLISFPELFAQVNRHLRPEMFNHHRKIYEWMYRLEVEQMRSWDVQIVTGRFGNLSELIVTAEPETIDLSVKFLVEEYDRVHDRNVYLEAVARLETDSPYAIRENVSERISDISEAVEERTKADELYDAWKSIESGEIGTKTCWPEFNQLTGGAQRGQTLILAGSTGSGKSQSALELMVGFAKIGKPSAFFSMELTTKQVWQRLITIESGLSMETLSNRTLDEKTGKYRLKLSEADANKLADAVKALGTIPLFVHDVTDVSNKASLIMHKIRWYKRKHDLFAYCIDFIQLCETGIDKIDYGGNETKILSKFAKAVSKFNKSVDVFGVWVSQLSRAVSTAGGSMEPKNSHLMGTSALENAADIIKLIYRPLSYSHLVGSEDEQGRRYGLYDTKHIISKNRPFGGKLGAWWVYGDEQTEPKSLEQPKFEMIRADLDEEDLPF